MTDIRGEAIRAVTGVVDTLMGQFRTVPPKSHVEVHGSVGRIVEVVVWLHNTSGEPHHRVSLRTTTLVAHHGATIEAREIPELDVAAFASAPVALTIAIPGDATPGEYHGHVLTAGASIPVRLVVAP